VFENFARTFACREFVRRRFVRSSWAAWTILLAAALLPFGAADPAMGQAPPAAHAPLKQRAVLYEEDVTNPSGNSYAGTVVWRVERVASAPGRKPDVILHADIDIPHKVTVRWSVQHNDDREAQASHLIKIQFTTTDLRHGSVANVPGVLVKDDEMARGAPLVGASVKVADNFFLIGLTVDETDRTRNAELLRQRLWIDLPLVYSDRQRAIVAFEKGPDGKRAFADALAAWDGGR
jgi:hypothetical protein